MSWSSGTGNPRAGYVFSKMPWWARKLSDILGLFGPRHESLEDAQRMNVGQNHSGEIWSDVLGGSQHKVAISHDGSGTFSCSKNSVAVYAPETADGRDRFPVYFDSDIYSM